LVFFSFYIAGMLLVAFSTTLEPEASKTFFFPGIMVVALGMGGLKPLG
jgi:dipeptide/tripeptide permease